MFGRAARLAVLAVPGCAASPESVFHHAIQTRKGGSKGFISRIATRSLTLNQYTAWQHAR